jgi:hypothetical protein
MQWRAKTKIKKVNRENDRKKERNVKLCNGAFEREGEKQFV